MTNINIKKKDFLDFIDEAVGKAIKWNTITEESLQPQMVDEALIHSYDTDVVIRHLCRSFRLADGFKTYLKGAGEYYGYVEKDESENGCSVIIVSLRNENISLLKEITLSMEKACGWFLSFKVKQNLPGHEAWQYEKKIDNDATSEVMSHDFLYHLCPTSRLQKILHVGLLPKKTTWEIFTLDDEHTFKDKLDQHYGWATIDRVYLFLQKPSDDFMKNNPFTAKNVFTDTYSLLQVNINKLLPNSKFYFDPRSKDAVYTMANIPPKAIKVLN